MAAGARTLTLRTVIDFTELKQGLREIKDEIVSQAKGMKSAFGGAFAFNQIKDALGKVKDDVAGLIQPFTALDTATAQLRTLGSEAAQIAPNLRDAAIQMSKELPFAAAELQQTMFDALASGVQGGEEGLKSFAATAAKLATGGGSTIGEATTLLAGQLNAYGKSSQDAGAFADTFFNIVNFGVTSIGELSSTLANVIPTAAGAGIELESVGGALAFMTQKGIPTAQSTTKLNQLLIELQKPAASLAPILKAAGVSLESLKQDDLPTTLEKVRLALDATGKSAVQVFGSADAAAAFQSLAGDIEGFRSTFEDVRDTTGSAQNAYEEMSDSIETRTKQMLSAAQAFVIEGLDAIGGGVVQVASAATQLAPLVTTLAGLKGIIPEGLFTKAATGLKDLLLPMLLKLGIVRTVGVATTAADTAATVANTAAKGVQAVATGGATAAQYALNTAMLLNPAFLLVAGIGALVAAFLIFGSSTKDLGEATEDAAAAREEFNATIEKTDALNKQASELDKLANEYDKLQGKADPESQKRLAEVSKDIAARTPEATDTVKQLGIQSEKTGDQVDSAGNKIQGTGDKINVTTALVRAQADEMRRLAKESEDAARVKLDENASALGQSLKETLEKQKELRDENAKFQQTLAKIPPDNPYFKSLSEKIKDNNKDLGEFNKQVDAASPEIKAQVETYARQGLTLDQIAAKLELSRDLLREFVPPDFKSSVVDSETLKTALDGVDEATQRGINAALRQGEAYTAARQKVGDLTQQLAAAKLGGDKGLIEDLQKQLDEAQKASGAAQINLQTALDKQGVQEGIKKLGPEAQKLIAPITQSIQTVADQKALQQSQQDTLAALSRVATERNNAAKALTDAERAEAEKRKGVAADEYRANLEKQATYIAQASNRLAQLKDALSKTTDPAEQKRLNAEIALTEQGIKKASGEFKVAVDRGRDFGLLKGDVNSVGKEFKFTGEAAKGVQVAAENAKPAIDAMAQSAKDLAASFDASLKSAQDISKQGASAITELDRQISEARKKGDKELARQLTERRALLKKESVDAVQDAKQRQKDLERTEIEIGLKERKKKAAVESQNFFSTLQQIRDDADKRRFESGNKAIADERARDRAAAIQKINDDKVAAERNLEQQELAIRKAARDKKPVEIKGTFIGPDGKEVEVSVSGSTNVLARLTEEKNKLLAAIEQQGRDALAEIDRKFFEKQVQEDAKRVQEFTKNRIADLQEQEAAVEGETEQAHARRLQLQLQRLQVQQAAEIDAVVTANGLYISKYAELQAAQLEVATATDKAAAEARVANLRLSLGQIQKELIAGNAEIQRIRTRSEAEQAKASLEAEKKSREAREKLRREAIPESAARERAQAIAEAEKTKEAELKVVADGLETVADLRAAGLIDEAEEATLREGLLQRRADAEIDAAKKIFDANEKYLQETDLAYRTTTSFLQGYFKRLYEGVDTERRKSLDKELQDLGKQRSQLLQDLRDRRVGYSDFLNSLDQLVEQQQEKLKELGGVPGSFLDQLKAGVLGGLQAIGESSRAELEKSSAKFADSFKAGVQGAIDKDGDIDFGKIFAGENGKQALTALKDTAINTFGVIAGKFGDLAASGRATLGDFLDATALAVIQSAESVILGNIPAIFATSIALLGPIAGIPAAAVAIALVEGLLATARSSIQSRQSQRGFSEGGYTGDIPADQPAGIVHGREFVHDAPTTERFRWLFERIHRGEDPADIMRPTVMQRDLSDFEVTIDGLLVRAMRAVRYAEREANRAASIFGGGRPLPPMLRMNEAAAAEALHRAAANVAAISVVANGSARPAPQITMEDLTTAFTRGVEAGTKQVSANIDKVRREVAKGNNKPTPEPVKVVSAHTIVSRG